MFISLSLDVAWKVLEDHRGLGFLWDYSHVLLKYGGMS